MSENVAKSKMTKNDTNLKNKNSSVANSHEQNSNAKKISNDTANKSNSQGRKKSNTSHSKNISANKNANPNIKAKTNSNSSAKSNLNANSMQNLNTKSNTNSKLNSTINSKQNLNPLFISPLSNTAQKLNLLDFTTDELTKIISPMFRVKQIFEWIYQKYADDFSQMTSLSKQMRADLSQKFHFSPLHCVKFEQSADKSIKYLFRLNDGLLIESVLLPMKEELLNENGERIKAPRYTICVSSQVGCKSGCSFCLTAKGGLKRNLSAGEIVGQILWIKKHHQIPYAHRVNVVYMGMGEPLDNLANVSHAVRILSDINALSISVRRQTISTSGLAKQIKELGKMNLGVLLAISLHAVDDELRDKLMPINKAYNIAAIMDAVRGFPINQRKKIMFEYLLIAGVNDSQQHAKKLVRLLNGIRAKVNLILFNPHEGSPYTRPSEQSAVKFQDILSAKGITCTIRQSKGLDISAACGQLKERTGQ